METEFPWRKNFSESQIKIIEFCLSGFLSNEFDYNSKPDGYETIAKMARLLDKIQSNVEFTELIEGENEL